MILFSCPYLGNEVEFSDERVTHVMARHPDLLPVNLNLIAKTLLDPDLFRVTQGRWLLESFHGGMLNC
jgi:hypothetical protein